MYRIAIVSLLVLFVRNVKAAEDFPSLLSANVSLAIVLDREFLAEQYAETLESIKEYMKELTREQLKHGGVNVHYYSWTRIALKNELSAVVSVAPCQSTRELLIATREQKVALLGATTPDCARLPPPAALAIPLLDPGQELPQLVLDMRTAKVFDWKSAVVIHDDTISRDMISRVVTAMTIETDDKTVSPIAITVFKMKHETNEIFRKEEIAKTLKKLRPKFNGENYCVIVTTDVMASVLQVAKSLNMVHPKSQWLFIVSDTDNRYDNITSFGEIMGEGENVAIIYNLTSNDPSCRVLRNSGQAQHHRDSVSKGGFNFQRGLICQCKELLRGFVLALDRAIVDEMEVAAQVSDEEWEAIRPTKQERSSSLVKHIESFLTTYSVCNNCSSWRIRSADTWGTSFQKRNESSGKIDLLQVGYWRPVDGLKLTDKMFPHVSHGFRGRALPVLAYHNNPWCILVYNESGAIIEHGGLVFDIVNELATNLNFTYYIESTSNVKYERNDSSEHNLQDLDSDMFKSATQEDVINIIESKGILLAASAFTITEERKTRINFTMPISIQPYAFLVSRPRELSRALLFMAPFASDTWLCLGFSVVLMGPALFAMHRLSPFYDMQSNKKRGGLANLHNCLWYMYGALLQQGGMYLPEADSGRLVVGTWWLVVLVVVTTYCGNLVAFLTFPRQEAPITTVRELLQHSATITWSLKKNSYLQEALQETDEQKYRQLYSGAILTDGDHLKNIDNVRSGKHVVIDWKINLQYIMKKEFLNTDRCDYALSTEEFIEEQMGMIMAKNSPYLTMINDEIKRMHQVGLIQKWLTKYLPKRDRCWNIGKVAEVNNHTVNLDDMQGCFFILFLGFFSAFMIILIECLCRRRRKKIEKAAIKPYTN